VRASDLLRCKHGDWSNASVVHVSLELSCERGVLVSFVISFPFLAPLAAAVVGAQVHMRRKR